MRKYLNIRASVRSTCSALIKSAVLLSFTLAVSAACNHTRGDDFLIGASPGLEIEQRESMLLPIARLLENTTGVKFRYIPPKHWPGYMEDMRNSKYSLLLDEPHLASWRLENLAHVPIVRLPGNMSFVIAARKRDEDIVALADIAGHVVCAGAPPALDGLILFEQFDNPSRQPQLLPTSGFQEAYGYLVQGRCRAAVLRRADYEAGSHGGDALRILYLSETFPNWTLSADSRISETLLDRIRQALLDPAGTGELVPGGRLLPANAADYSGLGRLLDNFWGLR